MFSFFSAQDQQKLQQNAMPQMQQNAIPEMQQNDMMLQNDMPEMQQNAMPEMLQNAMPEMLQNAMPQGNACGCGAKPSSRRTRSSGSVTEIVLGEIEGKEIVGMVVTMCSGSTYDGVFKSVEQKAGEGERVAVYSCSDLHPEELLKNLRDSAKSNDQTLTKMIKEIDDLEPCTVVFNWECCSGFSGDRFKNDSENEPTIDLMAYLLGKGYMVQVADFSAGALIKTWNPRMLGPNPFIKAGTFSDSVALKFDSSFLKQNEDSAQLQMVGDLCDDSAVLHAMGGTVAFTVDTAVKPSKWSEVEVLTVAVRLGGREATTFSKKLCATKSGVKGLVGHAIVRYPSGGRLLVGCPHWIELSNVNVTEEHLVEVAEKRYGSTYANEMQEQLKCAAPAMRKQMCQDYGSTFIKQSAPQKYKSNSKWYKS